MGGLEVTLFTDHILLVFNDSSPASNQSAFIGDSVTLPDVSIGR